MTYGPFGKVTALQSMARQVVVNAQCAVLTLRARGTIANTFESATAISADTDASERRGNIFGQPRPLKYELVHTEKRHDGHHARS
jgi:hypothetical protein